MKGASVSVPVASDALMPCTHEHDCRAFQNGRMLGKQEVPQALLQQLRWCQHSWQNGKPPSAAPDAAARVQVVPAEPGKVRSIMHLGRFMTQLGAQSHKNVWCAAGFSRRYRR